MNNLVSIHNSYIGGATIDYVVYIGQYVYNVFSINNLQDIENEYNRVKLLLNNQTFINLTDLIVDLLVAIKTNNTNLLPFFNDLKIYRANFINVDFSPLLRNYIISIKNNQSIMIRTNIKSSILNLYAGQTNFPEYNLINLLDSVGLTSILVDKLVLNDSFQIYPDKNISMSRTTVDFDSNITVQNNYTSIDDFKDEELVNSKFIKGSMLSLNNINNTVSLNGIPIFSLR